MTEYFPLDLPDQEWRKRLDDLEYHVLGTASSTWKTALSPAAPESMSGAGPAIPTWGMSSTARDTTRPQMTGIA